jgi:hypothetical protein
VPDVADGEIELSIIDSSDAQEDSSNAITKNKAAYTPKRSLTVTNLTLGTFDARRGSG